MGYFSASGFNSGDVPPTAMDGAAIVVLPRLYKPRGGTSVFEGIPTRFGGGTRSGDEWVCLQGIESVFVLPHNTLNYERIAGLIGACMGQKTVRLTIQIDDWIVLDALPGIEQATEPHL